MGGPEAIQVPYSSGRDVPSIDVPANACDCHHHIYDPVNFPYVPEDVRNQPPATVDAYHMLKRRLGLTRSVIVQPSAYGVDNSCTLNALKMMGHDARAVVVIDASVTELELQEMDGLGVRGIRFNLAAGAFKDLENILSLSTRVHEYGWHVQFWIDAQDTIAMANVFKQIPNQLVFDHYGHMPQPDGINHPAFKLISSLLDKGKAWVKISGMYADSIVGDPTYADVVEVGKEFVRVAPERIVFGTDWPHPSIFSGRKIWPNDAQMLSLLAIQAPDIGLRKRILVENPQELYDF